MSYKTEQSLLDQRWALKAYLEDLLKESGFAEDDEAVLPVQVEDVNEPPNLDEDQTISSASAQAEEGAEKSEQIPKWAQTKTQYLNFRVTDMSLTAPLEQLSGIIQANEPITALPGQASWMKGLLSNRGQQVKIIDTQHIIRSGAVYSKETTNHKYIMLIDEGRWGLTCDAVTDVACRESSEIAWQAGSRMRSFLAGTVIADLRTVVDVEALVEELNSGTMV